MTTTNLNLISLAFPSPKLSEELSELVTQYLNFGPHGIDEESMVKYCLAMSIHPANKDKVFYILHDDEIGYAISQESDLDCPSFFIINGHVVVPDSEDSLDIDRLAKVFPEIILGKLQLNLRILLA